VRANNTRAGVNMIFDEINKLDKSEIESKMFSDYEDRFQIFAGLALALLILELLILERKTKLQRKFKLFEE
jgi:Ca-activated chloride channel family protein